MCRLLINIGIVFTFLSVLGCGFVDLKPICYSTVPGQAYLVLPEPYSPVSLIFDTSMHESETKKCLQVLSPSGSVEGELYWDKNNLSFVPESPWLAGVVMC